MNFKLSEDQQTIIDGLRQFLDAEIEPAFLEHGEGFIPREKMQTWLKELCQFGSQTAPFFEEQSWCQVLRFDLLRDRSRSKTQGLTSSHASPIH